MSGTPVLPKKADVSTKAEAHHPRIETETKLSATVGFLWLTVVAIVWMGALFAFYQLTNLLLGR